MHGTWNFLVSVAFPEQLRGWWGRSHCLLLLLQMGSPVKSVSGNWSLQTDSKNPRCMVERGRHPVGCIQVHVSQSVCAHRPCMVIDILIRAYLCFCFKIVTYLHQVCLNCCCDRKCFFVDNYFTFSILLSGFLTTYGISVFHLFTPCSCQACLLLKISKPLFFFCIHRFAASWTQHSQNKSNPFKIPCN